MSKTNTQAAKSQPNSKGTFHHEGLEDHEVRISKHLNLRDLRALLRKLRLGRRDATPKSVTPECPNRGSSPNSSWIPAKSMRE
jgi:hypothetical protein